MRALLTGANGFVGSRILARLLAAGIATDVLLRPSSRTHRIDALMASATVCHGSLDDPESLARALRHTTHVIHCAGATKALDTAEYARANQTGTRRLLDAINGSGSIQRLVHLSSLAASHPALPDRPAHENDPPAPVTAYGRSKLAGEQAVRNASRVPWVILRPSAVYGPGDTDFLVLFRALRARIVPSFGGGRQPLSLVYVDDLADVAMACLTDARATGHSYNVAHPQPVTAGDLMRAATRHLGLRTLQIPLPLRLLWPLCLAAELRSRWTRTPSILSRGKYAELRAPGWVCDVAKLQHELGLQCPTGLDDGLRRTLAWYREHRWL